MSLLKAEASLLTIEAGLRIRAGFLADSNSLSLSLLLDIPLHGIELNLSSLHRRLTYKLQVPEATLTETKYLM